ncbi:hypothetical protein CFAM422_007078 [Trichoderma lentiforme]|uniref:Uncharacterized protein n=1 Tax=Trichoderma lentiforme TaxID=1567552 RepID=A0A9P4XEB3_9HYPO|nr:hypothetical protein CFAM422_007078 [Trichoderma lentiforme]
MAPGNWNKEGYQLSQSISSINFMQNRTDTPGKTSQASRFPEFSSLVMFQMVPSSPGARSHMLGIKENYLVDGKH